MTSLRTDAIPNTAESTPGATDHAPAPRGPRADDILGKLSGRSVRCYHCGEWFRAAVRAESASCCHCNRQVRVSDVHVRGSHWGAPLLTAGRLVIHRKGVVRVKAAAACRGVLLDGSLECGVLISGGPVEFGRGARFKGELHAMSIVIDPNAQLEDANICVPSQRIGEIELPRG